MIMNVMAAFSLPDPLVDRPATEIQRIKRREELIFRIFIGGCLLICASILLAMF